MVGWLQAAALALALFVGWAEAAASGPVTPLFSGDDLRSARPLAPEDALVVDVHTEVTLPGRKKAVQDMTVTLASTFTVVDDGTSIRLEDHALCRSLTWRPGSPELKHSNCHAAVAFRVLELQNRRFLAKVLASTGANDGDLLHLAEAELGVEVGGGPRLAVSRAGDAVEYRLGKTVVSRTSGVAGGVSPDEAQRVRRFLARTVNLHPQVRAALMAGGGLPSSVESAAGVTKLGEGSRIIRISNLRRASVAYPLPTGLMSALAFETKAAVTPRDKAIQRAAAVIDGQAPRPSVEALRAELRKAVAERRALDGMMLLLQMSQDQPAAMVKGDPVIVELGALMRSSPDVAEFMTANQLAGDAKATGDRERAALFLISDKMKAAPFATFRYVTYANLLASAGDTKGWDPKIAAAMPAVRTDNFWLHVAEHPWSSHTYKDVGDAYLRSYEVGDAWIAFDLGRATDADWRKGPMQGLDAFEDQLRAEQPDYF